MLLITVVGLCFGISLVTVNAGLQRSLGSLPYRSDRRRGPPNLQNRDPYAILCGIFSAPYFSFSIGLLIDPVLLARYAFPILAITLVVVLGKVFGLRTGKLSAGNDMRTSLRVGMGLAQIGEFSFIIASLGLTLKVTSDFIYPIAVAVSSLTTLLTPYLIKSSDGLVEWFDRVAPKPLLQAIDAYSDQVETFIIEADGAGTDDPHQARRSIALNRLIITGIFIAAVFLQRHMVVWWPEFPGDVNGTKAATWLVALLVSFPLLVAVWRKLEAGAMVVAEGAVGPDEAGSRDLALQSLISRTITVVGTAALVLLVALLSSTLLPSGNVLLVTLLIVLISCFVFYRSAVRLYSRAQSALRDTFAQPADPPILQETPSLPPLLREARLETVEVQPEPRLPER